MKYLVIFTVISTPCPPTHILDNPANISMQRYNGAILRAPIYAKETPENHYFSAFACTS